jgi:hypothetical protein
MKRRIDEDESWTTPISKKATDPGCRKGDLSKELGTVSATTNPGGDEEGPGGDRDEGGRLRRTGREDRGAGWDSEGAIGDHQER